MIYNHNVEILSRVIIHNAYSEAELILENAKKEAESIRKKGIDNVKHIRNKARKSLSQTRFSLIKGKIVSLAKFRARCEILMHKEEIIENILEHVRHEFYMLPQHQNYPLILKRLIIEAIDVLKDEGSEFVCRVNPNDYSLVSSSYLTEVSNRSNRKVLLDKTSIDIMGGVIVANSNLRVLYDNSLESLFDRTLQEMRCMAAECIFYRN